MLVNQALRVLRIDYLVTFLWVCFMNLIFDLSNKKCIQNIEFNIHKSDLRLEAFTLDPNTGLVRSRRLLQSSERFNLTVVATDQGRPPLWGTADLIITVIDVNDNRPVFVRPANGTIIHITEVGAVPGYVFITCSVSVLIKHFFYIGCHT